MCIFNVVLARQASDKKLNPPKILELRKTLDYQQALLQQLTFSTKYSINPEQIHLIMLNFN